MVLGIPAGVYWKTAPSALRAVPLLLIVANKSLWASAVQAVPTDKQTATMARRDVKGERDSVLGLDVLLVFIFC